jgi:hypothetical protein
MLAPCAGYRQANCLSRNRVWKHSARKVGFARKPQLADAFDNGDDPLIELISTLLYGK